jgi:hypothetical protein
MPQQTQAKAVSFLGWGAYCQKSGARNGELKVYLNLILTFGLAFNGSKYFSHS